MSTSDFTKGMIAQGMKTLLEKHSFEDISVGELVKHCRISRNTFYYHFKDKYDVISWIFYSEITPIIGEASIENWSDGLLGLCRYMQQNKNFYIKVLHVKGQNSFSECLREFYENLTRNLIINAKGDQFLSQDQISAIACFYAVGLTGVIIGWANKGMEADPEPLVEMLEKLFSGEIFDKIFAAKKKPAEQPPRPQCREN